jgi:hypothetical protein
MAISAKAVLHDTCRIGNRVPPHDDPPKFRSGRDVGGGLIVDPGGLDHQASPQLEQAEVGLPRVLPVFVPVQGLEGTVFLE